MTPTTPFLSPDDPRTARQPRRRCCFAFLALFVLLSFLGGTSATLPPVHGALRTEDGLPAAAIRAIEELVEGERKRQNIPGLSVTVVREKRLAWSRGFGRADLENGVPATPATVYRLGSISKPVTAVAVMQLVERGKIDLDAPVQTYVPAFPAKSGPVTVRQLLAHQGGVRHYNSPSEFDSTRHYASLADALAPFKDDPLLHEPGTKYLYTTHGYTLLGAVVEGASGERYTDYIAKNVFAPAGMTTARADDVFALIPHRAQGYRKNSKGDLENSALADTSNKIPGGGLCSTADDLAKFAVALMTDRLVKPETRAQQWTLQKTKDGAVTEYGLGWRVSARNGRREVHHGGAQQRVRTFLYLLPDEGVAVAVMCNLEGASLTALTQKIADAALLPAEPGK